MPKNWAPQERQAHSRQGRVKRRGGLEKNGQQQHTSGDREEEVSEAEALPGIKERKKHLERCERKQKTKNM